MELRVAISKAIDVLEKNLKLHEDELADAVNGWKNKVAHELAHLKVDVDSNGVKASYDVLYRLFNNKPHDNRADYKKHVGALRVAADSGETHFTVDEDDYDKIFADNWQWRTYSKAVNATYTSRDY